MIRPDMYKLGRLQRGVQTHSRSMGDFLRCGLVGAEDLRAIMSFCRETFRLAGNDNETGSRRGVSMGDSFHGGAVAGFVREGEDEEERAFS